MVMTADLQEDFRPHRSGLRSFIRLYPILMSDTDHMNELHVLLIGHVVDVDVGSAGGGHSCRTMAIRLWTACMMCDGGRRFSSNTAIAFKYLRMWRKNFL